MEAASGRRRFAFIAALALVLAAAALWASFALAGGSGTQAKAPAKPVAGQVADSSKAAKPLAKRHGDDGQCPFRGDQASLDSSSL